jgi:hypothetical protein
MEGLMRAASGPRRLRRERRKGYRMPEGAVYVGRPTKWGNPNRLDQTPPGVDPYAWCSAMYDSDYIGGHLPVDMDEIKAELRGRDLVCWCPLDVPCHADTLLLVANG